MHIGRGAKAARILAGLDQADLADRLGMTRQAVSDAELRTSWRVGTLEKYADALGFSTSEILLLAKMAKDV